VEEEAPALSLWDEGYKGKAALGSDSDSFDCDEGGTNDDVVVHLPSYDVPRPQKSAPRSHSTVSNASSSSSASTTSTASTSSCSPRPATRSSRRSSTSTTSTYRPRSRPSPPPSAPLSSSKHHHQNGTSPLIRPSNDRSNSLPSQPSHVTIAPIAPTILKTGTHSHYGAPGGWVEGFGDEGGSDDGLWGDTDDRWWHGRAEDEPKADGSGTSEGTNTPVELVFVPPLGSHYMHSGRQVGQREKENGDFSTGTGPRPKGDKPGNQEDIYRSNRRPQGGHPKKFSIGDDADPERNYLRATIPKVNIERPPGGGGQHDSFDLTGGVYSDEDPRSETKEGDLKGSIGPSSVVAGASRPNVDQSRSRSRSRSRTPSPAIVLPTTSRNATIIPSVPLLASPDAVTSSLSVVHTRKSASTSPPSSALLSPPLRGRGSRSHQDLQSQSQTQSRGRSSTRTAPTDRERSLSQYSSSIGSLSPEGVELGAAYASGRLDKELEREKRGSDRERSRGRERVGSGRLSQSLSPQDNVMNIAAALVPPSVQSSPLINSATSSCSSSSSSTATVVPSRRELPSEPSVLSEEGQVNSHPAPSNSPTLSMSDAVTRYSPSRTHYPSKTRSPIQVSAPHPVQPSTSFSISIPRIDQSTPSSPTSPRSPSSPTRPEVTIVGKAVGIVSSAFLGLWQHVGE